MSKETGRPVQPPDLAVPLDPAFRMNRTSLVTEAVGGFRNSDVVTPHTDGTGYIQGRSAAAEACALSNSRLA